jgi:UPF0271 protein
MLYIMRSIDLNADVGEGFGAYECGRDEDLMRYITSANVACGWHAGDPIVMRRTVECARRRGVRVGAHPGYPDLLGFGRRDMGVSPEEARQYVIYQVSALAGFAKASGVSLQHVKLHGAFYNTAMRDQDLSRAVADAIAEMDCGLIVAALPGSALIEAALRAGLKVAREAFPDRAYLADGSLAPRSSPGAVIQDPDAAAARAVQIVCEQRIQALSGEFIGVHADTICVHGDNPRAVALAAQIREALQKAGVHVRALCDATSE